MWGVNLHFNDFMRFDSRIKILKVIQPSLHCSGILRSWTLSGIVLNVSVVTEPFCMCLHHLMLLNYFSSSSLSQIEKLGSLPWVIFLLDISPDFWVSFQKV